MNTVGEMVKSFGGDAGGGKRGSNVVYERQVPKFLRGYYASRGELPPEAADADEAIPEGATRVEDVKADAKKATGGVDGENDGDGERDEIAELQESGFVVVVESGESSETRKRNREKQSTSVFGSRKKPPKLKRGETSKVVGTQKKSLLSFDAEDGEDEDEDED